MIGKVPICNVESVLDPKLNHLNNNKNEKLLEDRQSLAQLRLSPTVF